MKNPEWYKLLKYYEKKGYVYNGLTIPFLVGVERLLSGNKNFDSFELVEQFFSDKLPNKIGMINCDTINEYVFGSVDKETLLTQNTYSKPIFRLIDGLVINDDSFINHRDEQLKKILQEKYIDFINKENYSKNDGEWTFFTPLDLERINGLKHQQQKPLSN